MHSTKFANQTELVIPRVEIRTYLAEGVDPAQNQPGVQDPIYEAALVWAPPGGTGLKTAIIHLDRTGRPLTREQIGGLLYSVFKKVAEEHCKPEIAAQAEKFFAGGGMSPHNA